MKNILTSKSPNRINRRIIAFLGVLSLSATSLFASEIVYVTAATRPSGLTANADGQYTELHANLLSGTSAFSTAQGAPARTASRFRALSGFTNGEPIVRISPFLAQPAGIYRVHYTHSSTANNSSTAAIMGITNVVGFSLSFSETDAFQRKYGQPAPQPWTFLGYLTNSPAGPGVSNYFELFLKDTGADALTLRLLVDCFRFTLDEPCLDTPTVNVTGPLGVSVPTVTVTGVASNATAVTVYQNSGSGMVQIGTKTTDVTAGNNIVTVTGLVKDAQVAATQTIAGQQGCVPATGTFVGGGANPSVRFAITIKETTDLGPVGASATNLSSLNLHFVGASATSGGAPVDAVVLTPSTNWQTVTIGGKSSIPNSANVAGTLIAGSTYSPPFASVAIQVYPFKTLNESRIYSSATGVAQSALVESANAFAVNWTWNAVPGAEGYRVLRNVGGFGFLESTDVIGTNSFSDTDNGIWGGDVNTLPTGSNLSPSIQWNNGTSTNGPATPWGILESLNFKVDSDAGPFNIFVDNIQNGSTVFQTFETVPSGTQNYGFRSPSFSGTTSGNILTAPNLAMVTNLVADTGTNSLNVKFQWNGTNTSRWLRLTTSAAGTAANPLVNLDDPITVRLLIVPVGTVIQPPAQPPTIGYSLSGDQLTLTWTGTFNLQSKDSLSDATWTNVGVNASPYITTVTGAAKFYRLQAP